jgi:hypothetical protein
LQNGADFPVTLTFDSAFGVFDSPTEHNRSYGLPTFSAVPLPRPDELPGASNVGVSFEGNFLSEATGDWTHAGNVNQTSTLAIGDNRYFWFTALFRFQGGLPAPAELGASSLARFLGEEGPDSAGVFQFGFTGNDVVAHQTLPGTVNYVGTARLAEAAAPTPERRRRRGSSASGSSI